MTLPVKVYRNLHKHCWSVRSNTTGRVIEHRDSLVLLNPIFRVQKAGRLKVIQTKRKNVHAYVKGWMCLESDFENWIRCRGISYNPYNYETFVFTDNAEPVHDLNGHVVNFTGEGKVWLLELPKRS